MLGPMRTFLIPCLVVLGWWAAGCAPLTYRVQINGYTDPTLAEQISPGGSIFVIENKEAKNPLLEKEIRTKIIKLLEGKGYRVAPFEKAEYYLFFACGIGPGRNVTVPMPDYYPYDLGYFSVYPGRGSYLFVAPFFSFGPAYAETLYDRWLLLNVVDGKYYREKKGEFRTLWVGEARSTGTSADLRTAVNYLLLAVFEQFGQNTGKAVAVEIRDQDLRVKELEK
jgi:hypothetical protein